MSAKVNDLQPTTNGHGGGMGIPLSTCSSKPVNIVQSGSHISCDGRVYEKTGAEDRYSSPIGVDGILIRRHYTNVEGSLYWLHKKQPIAWPYNVMCLGDTGDEKVPYLTRDETKKQVAILLAIYSLEELSNIYGVTKACISNWKHGVSRAPSDIVELAKKHKAA